MPMGNKTGAMGFGPGTGRGLGYCRGFGWHGSFDRGSGRRRHFMPWGFSGRGRGHRFWFYATGLPFWARVNPSIYPETASFAQPFPYTFYPISKEAEIELLKRQAENLEATLEQVDKRLRELTDQEKDRT